MPGWFNLALGLRCIRLGGFGRQGRDAACCICHSLEEFMKFPLFALGLGLWSALAVAGEPAADPSSLIRQQLSQAIPDIEIRSLEPSAMPGIYEVRSNYQESIYVSADGKHFVVGELFKIEPSGLRNLTEEGKTRERAALLAAIPEKELVVFKAAQAPKAKVTIFTDVDCGYCRKLHQEVPQMNELGIQVNYAAFPRTGIGSESYNTMVSVWCADNRQDAMTQAKRGQRLPERKCENPVASQYQLGQRIGVRGTPAIYLEDGRVIPGYVPANALAEALGLVK